MSNEEITLKVERTSVIVAIGKAGRLWYQAPGLDIYVVGSVRLAQMHIIHYQAVCEAINRHIPARLVRSVGGCKCRSRKVSPDRKSLF